MESNFQRVHLQCDFIKKDSMSVEDCEKKQKIWGKTVFVGQLSMKIFILLCFLLAFTLTPSSHI